MGLFSSRPKNTNSKKPNPNYVSPSARQCPDDAPACLQHILISKLREYKQRENKLLGKIHTLKNFDYVGDCKISGFLRLIAEHHISLPSIYGDDTSVYRVIRTLDMITKGYTEKDIRTIMWCIETHIKRNEEMALVQEQLKDVRRLIEETEKDLGIK